MWFITAIEEIERGGTRCAGIHQRTFGFFDSLPEVLDAIEDNRGSMHEGLYDYLICERYSKPGIHPMPEESIWFRWEHGKWVARKEPQWAQGTICWAIG